MVLLLICEFECVGLRLLNYYKSSEIFFYYITSINGIPQLQPYILIGQFLNVSSWIVHFLGSLVSLGLIECFVD